MATIDTLEAGRAGETGETRAPVPAARQPRKLRRTRAFGTDDWLSLGGAALAAYALVYVGYDHLLDFSGIFGFGICWYLVFLLVYAGVVAAAHPRTIVVERLVSATLYVAAAVVMFALGTTIVYTFAQGWHAFVHLNFFTHDMAGVAPTAPLTQGGILHAIVGTIIEIAIAIGLSVPLGIGTAVYMTEVGGRGSQLVRTVVEAMTALPEILAGLFVYTVLIVYGGLPKSGVAVSAAMTVTMVPIIARAGEVALRVVPGGLREASSALGSNHWRTVWKVVLPSARAGLATATILAIARGIGETAIPLINSGASSFLTFNPAGQPMNSLPLLIYTAYTSHEPTALARGFGAASVLLTMVLLLFVVSRALLRDKSVQR
jgi:phosphate transport system permease protein